MKQDQENVGLKHDDASQQVRQIRDKFEYDRERRMRDKGMMIYSNASFICVNYFIYILCRLILAQEISCYDLLIFFFFAD